MEVKSESANWNPIRPRRGKSLSASVAALRSMVPGDVLRIYHPDVYCKQSNCTVSREVIKKRKQGWKLETYHEAQYIIVVRRLESRGEK